jgi:hypothetical protein
MSSPSGLAAALTTSGSIPYAQTMLALDLEQLGVLQRAVELLYRTAHGDAYQRRVDPGADAAALRDPGSRGVFMGYDFHLSSEGPRLIEINTNAGGALLNGLHTAALCEPAQLDWLCCDPRPVEEVEDYIVSTFRSEFAAARGDDATLRTIAIVDERPKEQFLYPEFELLRGLLTRHGLEVYVCDTEELAAGREGGIELDGRPIDLVYLRDTDFQLTGSRTVALRSAWLSDRVLVTPSPREHHLLADKRRMEIFSSREALAELGLASDDAAFLAEVVPETRRLQDMSIEQAWSERRELVFKPAAAFGSKAVYRGDKISKRRLQAIYGEPDFLAQRRVEPGTIEVATPEGERKMKFDVRAYAYRDRIFLLGARVYQGQVTNMRSPGGGFSAICVAGNRAGGRG